MGGYQVGKLLIFDVTGGKIFTLSFVVLIRSADRHGRTANQTSKVIFFKLSNNFNIYIMHMHIYVVQMYLFASFFDNRIAQEPFKTPSPISVFVYWM